MSNYEIGTTLIVFLLGGFLIGWTGRIVIKALLVVVLIVFIVTLGLSFANVIDVNFSGLKVMTDVIVYQQVPDLFAKVTSHLLETILFLVGVMIGIKMK